MRNLFRPPSEALDSDLESAMRAIMAATPLSGAHERELAYAVRDLSRLLTQDRAELARSYWINKRLLTAYCRYFLPWNLVRLAWLLPGLDLPMAPGGTILDLGSGPLTLPIALWLTKPEWRAMPLTVICSDVAPGPLGLGRDIFRRIAGGAPWKIELRRGPMDAALRAFQGKASLIAAINVLNEYRPTRETPLEARLEAFCRLAAARLAPEGRFLAIEPGTRLGGKLMAVTRRAGFASRMVPEAPCPHWGACPMLAERATGWCHFSHTAQAVPAALTALTRRAGLDKDSLSLSCLLLRRATDDEMRRAEALAPPEPDDAFYDEAYDDGLDAFAQDAFSGEDPNGLASAFAAIRENGAAQDYVRILSDPIRLPDLREPARYGCSARGLVLVHNALRMPSGAAFAVRWPEEERRDVKSGALLLAVPETRRAPEQRPGQGEVGPRHGQPWKNATKSEEARRSGRNTPKSEGMPRPAGNSGPKRGALPGHPQTRDTGTDAQAPVRDPNGAPARARGGKRQPRKKK